MTDNTTLTCTTRDDLLGIPELVLGHAPEECLILMYMIDKQVEFSLRMDAEDAINDPAIILERIDMATASTQRPSGEWLLLGYTGEIRSLANSMHYVASMTFTVRDAYLTDGAHSWRLDVDGHLVDEETCEPSARASTAMAVLRGQELGRTRASIAARIPDWLPSDAADENAAFVLRELSIEDRLSWMEDIVGVEPSREWDTHVLGWLMACDECAVELARSTKTWNAEARLDCMLAMLSTVPSMGRANALGVTALTSWLAREGVLVTELLRQLDDVDPDHPMMRIVGSMTDHAIPPEHWNDL